MAQLEQPGAVHVRSDRRYRFDVDQQTLWTAIEATNDYRCWWPWLRRLEANGLVEGDTWQCVVQPPLPYTLRFSVSLDRVVPPRLAVASIAGQIEGSARLEVESDGTRGSCEARLVSELVPANGLLKTVARFAQPAAQFGHDWILDTGARQFRARKLA
jgi:hypothetical protein